MSKILQVGQRIILTRTVDRFPHFLAPIGTRGTISKVSDYSVAVTMDHETQGAEEWDNSILWDSDCDTLADFENDITRTYLI